MKKNIALLAGGYSGEAEVSLKSAGMVAQSIDAEKYKVYMIIVEPDRWYYKDELGNIFDINKNDFSLPLNGEIVYFDCAFIMIHGTPGEDGRLQGYFDMLQIPYTGCDATTSALTFNKAFCLAVVYQSGLVNIAKSCHILKGNTISVEEILKKMSLPLFVKPNCGGSSVGMSKVKEKEELLPAIEKAFREDKEILIEGFVKGRELTCGMIKIDEKETVFPITEIVSKHEFFDYEAKYKGFSDEITPAPIPDDLKGRIQNTSSKLYHLLNCNGIVRFDFIYNKESDKLYFLEVNTVPGQSEQSIVPQQIRAMGKTTKEIYSLMIESVLAN